MKKLLMICAVLIGSVFALDQETECLVLKMNEKEFLIIAECMDPIKHFEDFAKRTGRDNKPYKLTFDGVWYKFKFD